jgi:hypothetical protein
MMLKAMVVIMHRNDVAMMFNKPHGMGGSKFSRFSKLDSSSWISAMFGELVCFRDIHVAARNEKWWIRMTNATVALSQMESVPKLTMDKAIMGRQKIMETPVR